MEMKRYTVLVQCPDGSYRVETCQLSPSRRALRKVYPGNNIKIREFKISDHLYDFVNE